MMGFVFLIGCSRMCETSREDFTPEEVVEAYLNISLNMSSLDEKEALLLLTTGNLKTALQQASDETLMSAFIKKNLLLESYAVIERRDRTPRETEVTFEIAFRNLGPKKNKVDPKKTPLVTTENTVSVRKEEGIWLIHDVLGKKTNIDFPISAEETITPK